MNKLLLKMVAILGFTNVMQAHTINLTFTHYAGKQYVYVTTGKLDGEGKAVLAVPLKNNYAGISNFILTDDGGMDFVVNKENFLISCTEEQPNFDNTKYIVSAENDYLNNRAKTQRSLLEKAGMIRCGLQVYKKEDALYSALEKEQQTEIDVMLLLELAYNYFLKMKWNCWMKFINLSQLSNVVMAY
ncbi:hypothetical protein [Flavobacterium sp. DG2-3]|uniref:hypothetical protein n=1 Tax=Flavobacterium sp. DG2-3 TaxID=3068317 RepID=UPI00273EC5DE|nr:hypothetical protein [Flavobacterium sp. DG2-3]MDP5201171.1 hypothetical protein [Flavobacterium sp. DG2-3]